MSAEQAGGSRLNREAATKYLQGLMCYRVVPVRRDVSMAVALQHSCTDAI